MSDEVPTPDEAQPTGTEPAPTKEEPQEKLIPQSQVDEIVKREKAKAERRVRKELEEAAAGAKKTEPKTEAAPAVDPVVADLKAKYEFAEALNDLDWKPSKEDRETLRDMFLAKGLDAMERLANRLKPAPAAPTPKTEEKATAPAPTVPSPIKTPGAPAGVPVDPSDLHPTQLTKGDIERMQKDGTFRAYLQRNGGGEGNGLFSKRRMPK